MFLPSFLLFCCPLTMCMLPSAESNILSPCNWRRPPPQPNVMPFVESFNLACWEASDRMMHFTWATTYDESITRWSMKEFTLFFFLLHCNHSNRTRINLLLSETTQESPLDLIIFFASFLHFPSAKLQQRRSEERRDESLASYLVLVNAMWMEMGMITI